MRQTYENRLKKELTKSILILSGVLIIIFLGVTFYNVLNSDSSKMSEALDSSNNSFSEVRSSYVRLLNDSDFFKSFFEGEMTDDDLYVHLYSLSKRNEINTNLVIYDYTEEIVFNSLISGETNLYLDAYNEILIDRMRETSEVMKINYNQYPSKHYYMMGKKITLDEVDIGYAIYYIDSITLANKIFSSQYDLLITNQYNNIIATSNAQLTGTFRFIPNENMTIKFSDRTYRVVLQKNSYESLNFYALVIERDTTPLFIQIFITFWVIGVFLIFFIRIISARFAKNNSRTISLLATEMEKIKTNDKYQIKIDTNDEFEQLAFDINEMVSQLRATRKRNELLLKQKNINELKRLEAQFNPHFLYNTLDTIRYAIFLDPSIAEKIILNMTKLLRYSVNNQLESVKFIDDYKFIEMYIEIHQHRKQNKILYNAEIDPNCFDVLVPKLFMQPIIENSIKYGLTKNNNLTINLKVTKKGKLFMVDIEDDGGGIDSDTLVSINENLKKQDNEIIHTGLFNTNKRLTIMYPSCQFEVSSTSNGGTKIHISFEVK